MIVALTRRIEKHPANTGVLAQLILPNRELPSIARNQGHCPGHAGDGFWDRARPGLRFSFFHPMKGEETAAAPKSPIFEEIIAVHSLHLAPKYLGNVTAGIRENLCGLLLK